MLKLLLLLAGIFFVYLMIGKSRRRAARARSAAPKRVEDMVRCGHCGVFLPKDEGVSSGEQYFCCKEHLAIAQSRRADSP